uniref:Uncharacterized protein n=1 Tax=Anguilla anguilla TaxID=7936 RepID=A0A0E9W8W3_ANGAN
MSIDVSSALLLSHESYFECSSGIFCDFLDELSLHPWRHFGRLTTPGEIHQVFSI